MATPNKPVTGLNASTPIVDGTTYYPSQWFVRKWNDLLQALNTVMGGAFVLGGNSYGAPAVIGTTDDQPVPIIVDGVEVARFDPNGGNPRLLLGLTSSSLATLLGSLISADNIVAVTGPGPDVSALGMGISSAGTAYIYSTKTGAGVVKALAVFMGGTKVAQIEPAGMFNLLVGAYQVAGVQVVGAQQPSIADAAGGAVIDVEARAALNQLLAEARTHGLIAT